MYFDFSKFCGDAFNWAYGTDSLTEAQNYN